MADISWCKKQKKGIKLIEPNDDLCREYILSSEETLSILKDIEHKSNMWLATAKYYCEYFIVYALLMKLGIRCEIHDCTIELCNLLEKENLVPKGCYQRLRKGKRMRIDNQYYLKNLEVDIDISEMVDFVLQIKSIINSLTNDRIVEIREKIS